MAGLVRAELASQAAAVRDPARAAAQAARLAELLGTGRYPRFAAAVAQGGPPATELGPQFERLLDRILDGLVSTAGPSEGERRWDASGTAIDALSRICSVRVGPGRR